LVVSAPVLGGVVGWTLEVSTLGLGVVGAVGAAVVSYPVLAFDGFIVVSLFMVVSVFTMVVSPRFGAAPVSSLRLWHAAKVAAAARIQRVFISSLLVATRALPAWGVVADVVSRGPSIHSRFTLRPQGTPKLDPPLGHGSHSRDEKGPSAPKSLQIPV